MVVESVFKIKRSRGVIIHFEILVVALDAENENAIHIEVEYCQEKTKHLFQDEQSNEELVE